MKKKNPTNDLSFKKSKIAKLNSLQMKKIMGGKKKSTAGCIERDTND